MKEPIKIEIDNAKIKNISIQNEGMLVFYLTLETPLGEYTAGGQILYNPENQETNIMGQYIYKMMTVIGVNKFENLINKSCRIAWDMKRIHQIGHYLNDEWFDFMEANKFGQTQ